METKQIIIYKAKNGNLESVSGLVIGKCRGHLRVFSKACRAGGLFCNKPFPRTQKDREKALNLQECKVRYNSALAGPVHTHINPVPVSE